MSDSETTHRDKRDAYTRDGENIAETFGDPDFFDAEPLERLAGDSGVNRTERATKATTTQQADVDEHYGPTYYTPPYDPEKLLLLLEQSETAQRCTTAISQGVCGYGFDLVPAADEEGEPPNRETVEEFWHGGDFQLGPDAILSTPEAVLEHVYHDRVGCGFGALELLINDATYEPTGAAHVPAHTIRARDDKPGYVQLDNGIPTTYYGPAGGRADDVFVDVEGNVGESASEVGELANELLVTNEYSALAPHYGIAPIVPALQTLSADTEAGEYQYRFFHNDGVPRLGIVIEGGELTDRAWDQLKEKLKNLKGSENAHRGILIEATGDAVAGAEDSVTVRIEPLTVGEQEEAGFIEYRKENEHKIAQTYNVPAVVRDRTEDVNYNTARQQRYQFAQEEIQPRQQEFAARLTKVIHETMLEVDGWDIEFTLKGGENRLRDAEVAQARSDASMGALTVNELRDELGQPALTDATGDELPQGRLLGAQLQQGSAGAQPATSEDVSAAIERARSFERSRDRKKARTEKAAYESGDVVDYGSGTGVVLEVMTSDFTWPQGEEDEIDVEASSDDPAYIVARESGGAKIYWGSELSSGSFDGEPPSEEEVSELESNADKYAADWYAAVDDPADPAVAREVFNEKANIPGVDDPEVGFSSLPEGWTRKSVLQAYASLGASWTSCVADMQGEIRSPRRFCSALKDEVFMTERWRGRF